MCEFENIPCVPFHLLLSRGSSSRTFTFRTHLHSQSWDIRKQILIQRGDADIWGKHFSSDNFYSAKNIICTLLFSPNCWLVMLSITTNNLYWNILFLLFKLCTLHCSLNVTLHVLLVSFRCLFQFKMCAPNAEWCTRCYTNYQSQH